ncbi:MAG: hypothetical protein JNM36_18545 [Chitinophagales bacterium]|nr:hypothetical protein [Chitinophagales bacterium]
MFFVGNSAFGVFIWVIWVVFVGVAVIGIDEQVWVGQTGTNYGALQGCYARQRTAKSRAKMGLEVRCVSVVNVSTNARIAFLLLTTIYVLKGLE